MSGLPPIPPRPDRTKARSPAPPAQTGGNGSTLGSDIPVIPPRPKRRIDRSQSPSKTSQAQASSTDEQPKLELITAAPSTNIPSEDGSDLVALEKTPTLPPTLQVPDMSTEQDRKEEGHSPIPEIRTVPDDLELQAPAPTVPRNSDNEKSEKLADITRTDSAQVAELDLVSASATEEDKEKPAESQLKPETHTAIMESVGQPEPPAEAQPQTVQEMDDQLEQIDTGFTGTAEVPRKKVEVDETGAVHVGTKDSVAEAVLAPESASAVEDRAQRDQERQREADNSSHLGPISAGDAIPHEPESSSGEQAQPASHEGIAHVNTSGIQLEETPNNDKNAVRDTVPKPERDATPRNAPDPELAALEKGETIESEDQKPQSGIEHYATSDTKDDKEAETSPPAPEEPRSTDKNEHDEVLGEPAEAVSASTLRKESAILSDSDSKEGSPKEVSSLDTVSNVKGDHIETHIPEKRPTTGAVAFHQEKQAEGIPLSYEEGRATTGVASIITPAIPPRPAKKITDPNSKPIPVPNLAPVIAQSDGPPLAERSPVLPSGPKPPVPFASKPIIPPRPARPPRPVKKDSLNGSEGAPLTTVSSASSARSLFEAGGPEAVAAAKAKPKPPVPARPIGNKIAALQAGIKGNFFAELNQKLGAGPTAPAKEEKKTDEAEEKKEVKPLADARKGRARGPARRAPAKVVEKASPRAATPTLALVQGLSFSQTTTVWEMSPEEGHVKVPSRAASPEPEKSEKAKGKEPEVVVKDDAPKVTESVPEIVEEALEVSKAERKEPEKAEEARKLDSPPAEDAVPAPSTLDQAPLSADEQQPPAEPAHPGWTGTTALGAVAMSAQEVVAETASKASKTIKDFVAGEEHVLSDVEDKDSAPPSDGDFSAPASPNISSQNDGPSETEKKAEELAAPENAVEPLGANTADIPSAEPPKLEAEKVHRPGVPQHPSETDYPPPCKTSKATTHSHTGSPSSLEAKAAELMRPENAAEPLGVPGVAGEVPSGVPARAFAGHVPAPATAPTSPPDVRHAEGEDERINNVMGGGASSPVLERAPAPAPAPAPAVTSPIMVRGGVVMESDANEPGQGLEDADPDLSRLGAEMSEEVVQTAGEDRGKMSKLGAMMNEKDDGLDGKAGGKFE